MDIDTLEKLISDGEQLKVEFKSWIRTSGNRERINLAVEELIALANTEGGILLFGVEDDGTVTGCEGYDKQKIIEAIYDRTRPSLFVRVEVVCLHGKDVIILSVEHDGNTYATTDGRCLKRLGKNSKPFYPEEMSNRYSVNQNPDFSGKILTNSSLEDINLMEVYNLKEKLKLRDPETTLFMEDDYSFLRDLGLIKELDGIEYLTVAGLLFVGKDNSISRLLPQAEVIYLHYSENNYEEYDARIDMKTTIISILDRITEQISNTKKITNVQVGLFRLEIADFSIKVFQEALLNALAHRDYESVGAIYIKHYPDCIKIENPGGFLEGITSKNIIVHPSKPRNKLIAETLQRLKYVQRTGQGVDIIYRDMISMGKSYPEYTSFDDAVSLTLKSAIENIEFVKFVVEEQEKQQIILSLPQLMILRYLAENKRIKLSEAQEFTQHTTDDTRKNCFELVRLGLIETVGKDYMLTAKVYEKLKSEVEYTRDMSVRYIKAKNMIMEYLEKNGSITNSIVQELCGFSKQQSRSALDKMKKENLIEMNGAGKKSHYVKL